MNLTRVTLDTNCLINLENGTGQYQSVRVLINAHRDGRLVACVTAMAASENQPGGKKRESYKGFEDWLVRLDAADLEEILPMCYWDISFWGRAVWSGDSSRKQERAIHDVLHPQITYDYASYCRERGLLPTMKPIDRRWLNAKCDVQALWSHVHAGNDVFVTEDGRFLTPARRSALIALGAGDILSPDDAVTTLLENR